MAPAKDSLKDEAIPKSAARVLNAQRIRDDFRRKRKLEDGEGRDDKRRKQEKAGKISLLIQPAESLQHFNKYVARLSCRHSCVATLSYMDENRRV